MPARSYPVANNSTLDDFEQAEQRLRGLQAQRQAGELDDQTLRLEVAKLLRRDQQGVFWMLDAENGAWFCNRGQGWQAGDPHAEAAEEMLLPSARKRERQRWRRFLAIGALLGFLLALLAGVLVWRSPAILTPRSTPPNQGAAQSTPLDQRESRSQEVDNRDTAQSTPEPQPSVPIVITSPADGSQATIRKLPPLPPANLQAMVAEDGQTIRLTWDDQSDNEDAFRIYREGVLASIGFAPADAESFLDEGASCDHTHRYTVVAFNAAGAAISQQAEVRLPCVTADLLPALTLTVVPTQVMASEVFTITFQANAGRGLMQVEIWGEQTGNTALDAGRVITCTGTVYSGTWPITWTGPASATLTIVAIAVDVQGQESEPARITVAIRPSP
jgi:hypothetical protein